MDLALDGKVALVTGAARDVGREIALTLAAEGAVVAVNYLSSATEAEAVVSEIKQKGGKAKAYKADVSDYAAVKEMVEAVVTDFGALNILVNNAGLAKRQRFVETTPTTGKNRSTSASMARSIAAMRRRRISKAERMDASSASLATPRASASLALRSSRRRAPAWWR